MTSARQVRAELLDELPPQHPDAVRSRADLRRVNAWMGHARWLRRELAPRVPARTVAELGSGDGTLMLRLARSLGPAWDGAAVTLVDRQPVVSPETLARFGEAGWTARVAAADAHAWLRSPENASELTLTNLFLHHFEDATLRRLLAGVAESTDHFVALEPRRSLAAALACRLLGLIGCNHVTRHDARVSVAAGFRPGEISALWPGEAGWILEEKSVGLFSHLFVARRRSR